MARTSQPPVRPRSTSSKTRMPPGSEAGAVGPSDLEGARAPDFTLPDQDDKPVSLRVLRQRGDVVLYFYPKDMTPGCTTEACSFRDNLKQLQAAGAQVVGVSADTPASHQKFIEKHGLTFPLLSDPGNQVTRGLWGLQAEVALRPRIHGHRTQYFHNRTRRHRATGFS